MPPDPAWTTDKPKPANMSDAKAKEWSDYHAAKGDAPAPKAAPKKEFKIIDNAYYASVKHDDDPAKDTFVYPFADINVGQGFFIPLEAGNTMDKLLTFTNKQVHQFRMMYSEIERSDDGDPIYENVTVRGKKRKPDGSIDLDGEGAPKLTADSITRPKLVGPMFRVRAIHKNDEFAKGVKSDKDGVLVIRLD